MGPFRVTSTANRKLQATNYKIYLHFNSLLFKGWKGKNKVCRISWFALKVNRVVHNITSKFENVKRNDVIYFAELVNDLCSCHANKSPDVIHKLCWKPSASWEIKLVDTIQILCHTFDLVKAKIY